VPASQPAPPLASLEERAYRAKPPRPSIHKQAEQAVKACQPYLADIRRAEQAKGLPRHTLTALGFTESRCQPKAENQRTRARGWGQFVPSGAAAVGRIQRDRGEPAPWFTYAKTLDPVASIRAAAELLAYGLETCGSLVRAIGMYNSGHCTDSRFARAVLRLAEAIRFVAGEEPRT
jgi:hypothetical protein